MPKWSQHKGRQHSDFLHILVNLCCAVCWKRCPLHFGYFTKAHSHSAACLLSSHILKPTHTTGFCWEPCMCVCFALLCFFWGSVSQERKRWRRESAARTLVVVSVTSAAFTPRRSQARSVFQRPSFSSKSSSSHVLRERTAMLRSGSLPLCGNLPLSQLSCCLTMALKPILFGVALAAGGASGQVLIAGDTCAPLSQR